MRRVGQPNSRQVGNGACRQDAAERPHHVGFLQTRDGWLFDHGDRALRPRGRRLFRRRGRRFGLEADSLGRGGLGRQAVGHDSPCRRGQRAEHEADERDHAHGGREGTVLRYGRLADDARARGVQAFLFLGFAGALEERLIDITAGLDVAFELAEPHRGLAHLIALALLRLQRLVQRDVIVAGAGQIVLCRRGEAIDLLVDGTAQIVDLLLHLAQRRMQWAEFTGQFGVALARFGILRPQVGDGRGLQCLGNRAVVGRGAAAGFDLVVFGLGVERGGPCRGKPLVAGGKLLIADQRVLGADEIVLRLVDRKLIFRAAQTLLQFHQTTGQIFCRTPRGGGLRVPRFRQVGVGERIGEHRRLRRLPRPDIDIDDEATVGLLDGNVAVQGVQRRHLLELIFIGGRRMNPDQAEQRRHGSVGDAAELGILVDAGALDHLQQHIVRGDQARLAFHDHRESGDVLGTRRQFAIDQLQFAWVDIKLRGGGGFGVRLLPTATAAQAQINPAAAIAAFRRQIAAELQHASIRQAFAAPLARRWSWPGLSVGHKRA